jgi:restriction system protein
VATAPSAAVLTGDALWTVFLQIINGVDFERIVLATYATQGFLVKPTPVTGDRGLDGLLILGERLVGLQIKRYRKAVPTREMLEFVGALHHHRLNEGIFVTTSRVTKNAKSIAACANITVLEHSQIRDMLLAHSQQHLRRIVNDAHPHHGRRPEEK